MTVAEISLAREYSYIDAGANALDGRRHPLLHHRLAFPYVTQVTTLCDARTRRPCPLPCMLKTTGGFGHRSGVTS